MATRLKSLLHARWRQAGVNPTRIAARDPITAAGLADGPAWRNRRPWYDFSHLTTALGVAVTLAAGFVAEAGDILRGGAPAGTRGGPAAPGAIPAQAAQSSSNARDALARTTQAVQAVKAMQNAAREAAAASNNLGTNPRLPSQRLPDVPDGLAPGGLQVAPGVPVDLDHPVVGENPKLWTGATLPYQTNEGGRKSVIVHQTKEQAVLTWQTFNVGKNTTLNFDQNEGGDKRTQWVVFNKIQDPSGAPSQILGSIKADGHVYVINQNGIIFGGTSQINTHGLVASSLQISDNLIKNGLLNNPTAEFLFSSTTITDPSFKLSLIGNYTLAQFAADGLGPTVKYAGGTLVPNTDYTITHDSSGKTVLSFTPTGRLKVGSGDVTVSYTFLPGDVVVQAGGLLSSPTTPEHVGGRVALVGPNVKNEGTIETPDGQTILAAGLQVGFTAHAASDPSLRGLDTFVGAEGTNTGAATNSGLISAPRASVVMTGKAVNQLGVIDSSTSVTLNGRIDLLADYDAISNPTFDPLKTFPPFFLTSTGTVTLGPGSVTQILPEYDSTETIASSALPLSSQATLRGQVVHLESGSMLFAPNAAVSLQAGLWDSRQVSLGIPSIFAYSSSASPAIQPQIFVETGAMINVAGTPDVSLPISQNFLTFQPRGAELADSPLQRTGPVRGTTLEIDLRIHGPFDQTLNDGKGDFTWVGTPLANAKGFRDLVKRSVSELTTNGGSVSLTAGGSVVLQPGSTIDVSGGWINFQGGIVQTTRLLSQGQVIDISQATPDRVYDGIYTGKFTQSHPKYGLSETFTNPLVLSNAHFEPGYISGAPGGSIAITAPSMALDGTLLGNTVAGPRQRNEPTAPSALSLRFQQQDTNTQHFPFSPTPPRIVFQNEAEPTSTPLFTLDDLGNPQSLSEDRQQLVLLSPELLTTFGFARFSIEDGDGTIIIPEHVELTAPVAGTSTANRNSISLSAANISIDGKVSAPRGDLTFVAYNSTPYLDHLFPVGDKIQPAVDRTRGQFVLGPNASLSTSGLIVDDRFNAPGPANLPTTIDGGRISIRAFSADLATGSSIDVSGGAAVSVSGKRTYGAGGSIQITAGQDPNDKLKGLVGGTLRLGSTLSGFSGAKGGSLEILAPMVQIGGTLPATVMVTENEALVPKLDFDGTLVDPGALLLLQPDFFSAGGFQSFTIRGLGIPIDVAQKLSLPAITVAPGTIIAPRVQSFTVASSGSATDEIKLVPTILPDGIRTGVAITLRAEGVEDNFSTVGGGRLVRGDVILGVGSVLRTDPFTDSSLGVTISGQTATVLGSIFAPGGTIQVTGSANSTGLFLDDLRALATVHIGPDTVLSAAGTPMIVVDGRGLRTGSVLNGGKINISGNIVAEKGALFDVSGSTGILDQRPAVSGFTTPDAAGTINALNGSLLGQPTIPTRVESNGGSITLKGGAALFSDASLVAAAGGPNAVGGSLEVSSGLFIPPGTFQTPLDPTLTVKQSGSVVPDSFDPHNGPVVGRPIIDVVGKGSSGGYIAASSFASGGFDRINLRGTVKFDGPVSIAAGRELHVADGGVILADDAVHLSAPYVTLGTVFVAPQADSQKLLALAFVGGSPFYFSPMYGAGSLTVEASLIDIGNLSLQGIGQANFIARNGEIRGDGILDVAGAISMTAAQIYPATGVSFTIAAYDKNILIASSAVGNPKVILASATLPPGFGVGSPLLGSTVVSIVGNEVTLAAGANANASGKPIVFEPGSGSVTISSSGALPLPLSAGGTLSIYGSTINQGGTVLAPGGTINIGWDGTGSSPVDYISGAGITATGSLKLATVATAQSINLLGGSITSVSLVDPITKQPTLVPYGLNLNGTQWIDPSGTDITAGGIPGKAITISGVSLTTDTGSLIDISGGGDLMSYRWVPGVGGSKDILLTSNSFAIIPGYESAFAPYAPFNPAPVTDNLGGDPGYVNSNLRPGDRIYLQGGGGLPAGEYTLLPARYALMPGAFLVTPQSGTAVGSFTNPDGSTIVSGRQTGQSIFQRYEVASSAVIRSRSQFEQYFASDYLRDAAKSLEVPVPRLPIDSGHLILSGSQMLALQGAVRGQAPTGGHGAAIDISTLADIFVGGKDPIGTPGAVVLDASLLNSYGAESLLIGGIRQFASTGTTITVKTPNATLDNAGSPLMGPEIILVAKQKLTLAPNAEIQQTGSILPTESGIEPPILIGSSTVAKSGDGTLLRVSALPTQIIRSGVSTSTGPSLTIGAGAHISGNSITLDSTDAMAIDPSASLLGNYIAINAGRISLLLTDPGTLQASPGLVLSGSLLAGLQNAQTLSLLSYSTLDIYGHGIFAVGNLELHAGEIRGFNHGGGSVTFNTDDLLLDNIAGRTGPGAAEATQSGTLIFNANTIRLGANQLNIEQYATLELNAPGGVLLQGTGGLSTAGSLVATTPFITGQAKADQTIKAAGALIVQAPLVPSEASPTAGLGVSLTLEGTSIVATGNLIIPSGLVKLHATDGDITVGGLIDVGGTAQKIYDTINYTDAGQISLLADRGSVTIDATGILSVAAHPNGGNAGTLEISARGTTGSLGTLTLLGTVFGQGGSLKLADGTVQQGRGGTFLLDVGALPSLASLDAVLNFNPLTGTGGFTYAQNIRVRSGDVAIDATATTHSFDLSADQGSITVTGAGKIDAHGETGGTINLIASGSIVLESGAILTVEAADFSAAGKGGAISLEAGSQINGASNPSAVIDIRAGSQIVLSVTSAGTPEAVASAARDGQFTGTLHLRAPQNASGTDVNINTIAGQIDGASSIVVEGYRTYTPPGGFIDLVEGSIFANASVFANNSDAIAQRIFGGAPPNTATIVAGAEIINPNGDLTLLGDWDLSTFRFGPRGTPGVLTMRAAGNLVFNGALSDGFTPLSPDQLYAAPLMAENPLLPVNAQSWSYRLTAGADLSAADFRKVRPLDSLAATTGSLKLGVNYTPLELGTSGLTSDALLGHYQVIRTGSGDITISVGRDVQLLNPFATIYTAGTQLSDASTVSTTGDFDLPNPFVFEGEQGDLGSVQNQWIPQFSRAGGNVTITAQGNIEHKTMDFSGKLVDDSVHQIPTNWLYRRSKIGSDGRFATGEFGDIMSTSWWVDFSNFFEGVGALGGGNVSMIAGGNISNVDAVIPTNARMAGRDPSTGQSLLASSADFLEHGGGDLLVRAGGDINGGIYYVERGRGILNAGQSIHTNATRAPALSAIFPNQPTPAPESWLPTTLFLGKGSFDVSARGDITLGPTLNAFLTPEGLSNSFRYRTYFSTFAPDSAVSVSSLGGSITLREAASVGTAKGSILRVWLQNVALLSSSNVAFYEPWIRLNETAVTQGFDLSLSLQPASLRAVALSGDINLAGNLTLSPAPRGTLDLIAAGAINGLSPIGSQQIGVTNFKVWDSSQIVVSDTSPANVPGIRSSTAGSTAVATNETVFATLNALFAESGSLLGAQASIQTKLALHDPTLLHKDDPDPVRLYAGSGNIADLTLFAPKAARVFAGKDLTDTGFYLQNLAPDDFSVIASGRDIVAYNPNSPLLQQAQSPGNITFQAASNRNPAQSGDIQISGPGTLEVLAGRNLDLGSGRNTSLAGDLGVGITSIGNVRNPFLPFAGADIIVAAGVGGPADLFGNSTLQFPDFIDKYLAGKGTGATDTASGSGAASGGDEGLSDEEKAKKALEAFFIVLRDAGRNHNLAGSPGFGTYTSGFTAISDLFGKNTMPGDIELSSRSIKTATGGDIKIIAPGGGLSLGFNIPDSGQAPPGIVTEHGGSVYIFTNKSVQVGALRIFTLRGGSEIIWSSTGDIAAGNASKTVQTAPPTRVVIDAASADVQTDLAGLATGGGIGVLATVGGVPPGDVDLIAPAGVVDAGDAGIRATGNLTIAAVRVLNADNIQVTGTSTGVPTPPAPPALNIGAISAANNATAAGAGAADQTANQARNQGDQEDQPSTITVEVVSFESGE